MPLSTERLPGTPVRRLQWRLWAEGAPARRGLCGQSLPGYAVLGAVSLRSAESA